MFQPAASSRSDHRRMFVTVDFFMLIPPGNKMKPSNGSPVTGFRMCSLCTSPTPAPVEALSEARRNCRDIPKRSCNSGYTPPKNSISLASVGPPRPDSAPWGGYLIFLRRFRPRGSVRSYRHQRPRRLRGEAFPAEPTALLRRVTIPVAAAVVLVVAAAWYATWTSADFLMALMAPSTITSTDLALFFALLLVMMVAMMLPSAMPMILAYRGLTRLEAGQIVRPADALGTFAFVGAYFLVWGAFGVAALFALMALGILGPWTGVAVLIPAGTLVAAGAWQVTRTKAVCLKHCTSPMGFVMHHWRSGRVGAWRMGLRHSLYCVGCCWLFMIVLFVAGSMSLVWMGGLSIAILTEKLGVRTAFFSRMIGLVLLGP